MPSSHWCDTPSLLMFIHKDTHLEKDSAKIPPKIIIEFNVHLMADFSKNRHWCHFAYANKASYSSSWPRLCASAIFGAAYISVRSVQTDKELSCKGEYHPSGPGEGFAAFTLYLKHISNILAFLCRDTSCISPLLIRTDLLRSRYCSC